MACDSRRVARSVHSGAVWQTGATIEVSARFNRPPHPHRRYEPPLARERWSAADLERTAGAVKNFPKWYYDPVTDRQLERLERDGISVSRSGLTKGRASDLIGLLQPVQEEDERILRFFKFPRRDMNETRGRYEVAKLLADPKSVEAWSNRPAEPLQREYLRFFDIKAPTGLTYIAAEKLMAGHDIAADDPRLDEWESFESLVEEMDDKEFREEYEIKKPSLSLLRSAVDALCQEGHSMRELKDDIQLVVDKLVELKPDLQRQS